MSEATTRNSPLTGAAHLPCSRHKQIPKVSRTNPCLSESDRLGWYLTPLVFWGVGMISRWTIRVVAWTRKRVCPFRTFVPFWFNRIIVYFAAFASTLPLPLLRRPSALALLQDLGLALLPDGLPACIADVLFAQLSRRCWPGLERRDTANMFWVNKSRRFWPTLQPTRARRSAKLQPHGVAGRWRPRPKAPCLPDRLCTPLRAKAG